MSMVPTTRTTAHGCRCCCRACLAVPARRTPMCDAFAPARESSRGSQHRLSLKEGGMLKVQGGDGIRVMALEGKLWIIQDADVRDYELEAGQSLCLGREGATLIQ